MPISSELFSALEKGGGLAVEKTPPADKPAPQGGGSTFDRLLRQESGGRQTDKNGNVITSSKGAIGIAQVMPATGPEAAKLAGVEWDPVRFKSDAEYNKALGRAYFDKQLSVFGDERLALAAYNAGPGAVRLAIARSAKNGGDPLEYLPLETQKYVPAILGAGAGVKPKGPKWADDKAIVRDDGRPGAIAKSDAVRAGPTAGDMAKAFGASALSGVGDMGQGLIGEPLAWLANKAAGTEEFEGQNLLAGVAESIRDDMTEGGKIARQDVPSGDVFQRETWKLPETTGGMLMIGASSLGSLVPSILPFVGPASKAANLAKAAQAAKVAGDFEKASQLAIQAERASRVAKGSGAVGGFAMTGGAAAGEVRQNIERELQGKSHEELLQNVPLYREAFNKTGDARMARQAVANGAAQYATLFAGAMGAVGGGINAKLLEDVIVKRGLSSALGKMSGNAAVRAGVGAGAGAVGEGLQEVSEKMGQNAGENIGMGRPIADNVTRDSFGDFIGGAMIGGPMGGVGGGASLQVKQPVQPVIKQNSPLSNMASVGQAAQANAEQASAQVAPEQAGAAVPGVNTPAQDPTADRLAAMQSFVEDKAFIQALRGTEGYGPESVTELLSAYAKARNPNIDPRLRERALSDLEKFVETFNNRPNFVFGKNTQEPTPQPGQSVAPYQQQGGAVGPAIRRPDGRTLDGEIITRPEGMAGANPNQLKAPPVLGLPTEEALQAKRQADADYEQAYQDLVKAEQLGANEAEIADYQRAMLEAERLRDELAAQLADSDARVADSRQREAEARRRDILGSVIEQGISGVNPVADVAGRFSAELMRQGYRDTAPTDAETQSILRAVDVANAREDGPLPSLPNEGDFYAPPKAQRTAPPKAESKPKQQPNRRLTPKEIREYVAAGAVLNGDTLTLPDGTVLKLKGPQIAAAREAMRKVAPAQVETAPDQANESEALPQPDAPQQVESPAAVSDEAAQAEMERREGAKPAEFEHRGVRIYPANVSIAGERKQMWGVESSANKAKREAGERYGFGDSLHGTREQAINAADRQIREDQERAEYDRRMEEVAAKERADDAARKADTINGFLEGKAPNTQELIRKALDKQYRFDGTVMTVRERIESLRESGELVTDSFEEPRIKPMSRVQFNRASQREQDAHEKKMREAGTKTVYTVSGSELGKYAYDYAQHLLARGTTGEVKAEIRSAIDAAAHEAATSPLNDTPQPTDGQKSAGNYKVGRVRVQGMDISIENPKGSVRSGTSPDGRKWESTLHAHYGYFTGTKAADGDHLDVYLTDGAEDAPMVWVIDQKNADGAFDEHKTLLGPRTEEEAKAAYLANYEPGWDGIGAISSMPIEAFKAWAFDGKKKRKPLVYVEPDGGALKADEVARIIHESIAENAIKNSVKYNEEGVSKGRVSREVADASMERTRQDWAKSPINDRTVRLAKAIVDKEPRILVGAWAKEGQGTYGNEGSMNAFEKITGVKLRRLNSAQRAKAIFDWAGWSEEQVAEDVSRRRAELEELKAQRQEKDDKSTADQAERAQIKIRETGEVKTVREYIDGLIADGYTEIRTAKRGAVTKTVLANAEGWGRYLSSGIVKEYAVVASRRALDAKASGQSNPDTTTGDEEAEAPATAQPDPREAYANQKAEAYIAQRGGNAPPKAVEAVRIGARKEFDKGQADSGPTSKYASGDRVVPSLDVMEGDIVTTPDGKTWMAKVKRGNSIPVVPFENGKPIVSADTARRFDLNETVVTHSGANFYGYGNQPKPAPADQPTHQDPGQPSEPVTPAVVAKSIQKSARNTEFNPVEAKKWLLGEIDKAVANVPAENAELAAELAREKAKTFDPKLYRNVRTVVVNGARGAFNELRDSNVAKIAKQIGFVTFDVPGDGKFKVMNTVDGLNAFRSKVEKSPGFARPTAPRAGRSMPGGPSLDESIADAKKNGGSVLPELGNAIEIARLRGKEDDTLLDRFKENSGGKSYDEWRAEQEAAEEIAAREEAERNRTPSEKEADDAKRETRSEVAQPSDLTNIFAGLSSRGLAKTRAQKAADAHPRAEQIAYVQDNFLDILTELEDSGIVKINCD